MRRVRVQVRGQVQGVSYRASTVAEAHRLGVTGWVKNHPDGSVVLEAQGPAGKISALVDWCHAGPPFAQVAGVDVIELRTVDDEDGFAIAR